MIVAKGAPVGGEAALLAQVDDWLEASPASGAVVDATAPQPSLDLEVALQAHAWSDLTSGAEAQLDRLRKKIEVARKLCRYYLPDLSRAVAPTPLSAAAVRRLCALLLKAALLRRDARYLNSALKLLDGVLGRNDCTFPQELREFAQATLLALVPPGPQVA
jgi:hypothetical protein